MLPSLETIKEERKKLNMTQKKLATMTGVSTSMINQIESGRCKPSYNTAKKIFESLAKLEGQTSTRKAGDICSEKIVRLAPSNTIREAGKKMHEKKNHGLLLMPKIRSIDVNDLEEVKIVESLIKNT